MRTAAVSQTSRSNCYLGAAATGFQHSRAPLNGAAPNPCSLRVSSVAKKFLRKQIRPPHSRAAAPLETLSPSFAAGPRVFPSRMNNPDQLRELFRMQQALNARIGVHTATMTDEEKTKWILNYCRAMTQEIAELTDSVPWKWWAKYQKFDEQNARVEVVDLFHFLISLAQVLGMSADDVFAAYVKKNEVNFKRQESGYTQKDHGDSKHI
jgi:dimeric dUTPase (all-alpha-NTP-PPase superfamily)